MEGRMIDPNSVVVQNLPEAEGIIAIGTEQIELTSAKYGVWFPRTRIIRSYTHYQRAAVRLARRWRIPGTVPGIPIAAWATIDRIYGRIYVFAWFWQVKRN